MIINKYDLVKDLAEEFSVSQNFMKRVLRSYYNRRLHALMSGHELWTVGGKIWIGDKTRKHVYVPPLDKVVEIQGKKIKFAPSRRLYGKLNKGVYDSSESAH